MNNPKEILEAFNRGVGIGWDLANKRLEEMQGPERHLVGDVVAYNYKGERIGRISPALDGPTGYEPCVPVSNYKRVDKPSFPLERDLYGTPLIQQNANCPSVDAKGKS